MPPQLLACSMTMGKQLQIFCRKMLNVFNFEESKIKEIIIEFSDNESSVNVTVKQEKLPDQSIFFDNEKGFEIFVNTLNSQKWKD